MFRQYPDETSRRLGREVSPVWPRKAVVLCISALQSQGSWRLPQKNWSAWAQLEVAVSVPLLSSGRSLHSLAFGAPGGITFTLVLRALHALKLKECTVK